MQYHPPRDEHGNHVLITHPSAPVNPSGALDLEKIASFVPVTPAPPSLNGIASRSLIDAPVSMAQWSSVSGQAALDELRTRVKSGKKAAAGVVIEEPDGPVWVVSPTHGFAGYLPTFPKGQAAPSLPLQAIAI